MKSFILLILTCFLPLFSTPVYYSFSGVVTEGLENEIPIGTNVGYLLKVDKERPGYDVHHQAIYTYPNPDHFYVESLGELPNFKGPMFGDKGFFGSETVTNAMTSVNLVGSDLYYLLNPTLRDRTVSIRITSERPMDTWAVGDDGFIGYLWPMENIQSSLILTGISDTHPSVPEPSSFLLLGAGVVSLLGLKRKFTKTLL